MLTSLIVPSRSADTPADVSPVAAAGKAGGGPQKDAGQSGFARQLASFQAENRRAAEPDRLPAQGTTLRENGKALPEEGTGKDAGVTRLLDGNLPVDASEKGSPVLAAPQLVGLEDAEAAKIALPEPLGDQWQLPVTGEVRDWLAGEPMTEAMAEDPLVQVLESSPALADELARALEVVPAGMEEGLAVLLPTDSMEFSGLDALELPVIAGQQAAEWLQSVSAIRLPEDGSGPVAFPLTELLRTETERTAQTLPVDNRQQPVRLPGDPWQTGVPAPVAMEATRTESADTRPVLMTAMPAGEAESGDKVARELMNRISGELTRSLNPESATERTLTTLANESPLQREPQSLRATLPESMRQQQLERPVPFTQGSVEMARQMGERVVMMIGQNMNDAMVRLDPPEMGPVEIRIQTGQDQVQVQLSAQQPMVREMLEQQAHRLRDMMGQQGFTDVDLAFSDQGAWSDSDESPDNPGGRQAGDGTDAGEDLDPADAGTFTRVGLVDHYV